MKKFERVAILGAGAFGIALAKLAALRSNEVLLWTRDQLICDSINRERRHPHKLSSVFLPSNIIAKTEISSFANMDVIILALPIIALRPVLESARNVLKPGAIVVCTAKGIEEESLALSCDIVKGTLKKEHARRACYLSGPSFAYELAMDLPTALTLGSFDKTSATMFQEWFSQKTCRIYRSGDVIGVCVGGALKNVIAIAAGACSGLALGKNALAALITRGLAETMRLAVAMGGKQETLRGLSGAGDLILSCTDDMSRNHRLGTLLADGLSLDVALNQIGSVVEGANTAKAIPGLISKYHVEMPISLAVTRVLYEGLDPKVAISLLLERKLKEESI